MCFLLEVPNILVRTSTGSESGARPVIERLINFAIRLESEAVLIIIRSKGKERQEFGVLLESSHYRRRRQKI